MFDDKFKAIASVFFLRFGVKAIVNSYQFENQSMNIGNIIGCISDFDFVELLLAIL
jgi:hypothetical protein